ncbi:hypothetical protein PM082_001857 [Marasmius tenuissimus]|nr:hypothetical protein PM082_001857 [Marasmius tenuissimus]
MLMLLNLRNLQDGRYFDIGAFNSRCHDSAASSFGFPIGLLINSNELGTLGRGLDPSLWCLVPGIHLFCAPPPRHASARDLPAVCWVIHSRARHPSITRRHSHFQAFSWRKPPFPGSDFSSRFCLSRCGGVRAAIPR